MMTAMLFQWNPMGTDSTRVSSSTHQTGFKTFRPMSPKLFGSTGNMLRYNPETDRLALPGIAKGFAFARHFGQVRKYNELPYIIHPEFVAKVLFRMGAAYEVQAAGWCHDLVEDTDTTLDEIEFLMGSEVRRYVWEVTSPPKSAGTRKVRKAMDLERLSSASYGGKTIKLIDGIDNMPSIAANDPEFAKVYFKEKEDLLPALVGGNDWAHLMYSRMIEQYKAGKTVEPYLVE